MKPGSKSLTIDEIKAKLEYYCAYQDRCHQEVEKKLDEFFLIDEARDAIILSLINDNFLNEERFAKSFARGKFYQKRWGRIKIKHELKKRNISEYLISLALKEIDPDDYFSTLEQLIEKKKEELNIENDFELKGKLLRFFSNKGFEYELINEIIN